SRERASRAGLRDLAAPRSARRADRSRDVPRGARAALLGRSPGDGSHRRRGRARDHRRGRHGDQGGPRPLARGARGARALDRRAIRRRIQHLEEELARLERQRTVNRARRLKGELPHVAIVGYTNVGKSTLFNRITDSKVSTEDRQFDTLDPTVRRRRLPSGRVALFSDTVGFIRELPKGLVEAFAATLEELRDARLLIHVADANDASVFERIEQVRALLRE